MHKNIDLRGTPCPVNFVRCRLELQQLNHSDSLQVDLDRGEPEEMVIPGLINDGFNVKIVSKEDDFIRFIVIINDK
ncbi:sulfurtransferase TusA family protein [Prochlorococcus marinus]|uniref:sulfurtransferase TusA family protein n=1 Tax=Prochlorococcus marinus TaxID=1219 RepID=UPI0022B510B4|nr:sulfurtransferase TusA family protein [Prochlorococcus marinus]